MFPNTIAEMTKSQTTDGRPPCALGLIFGDVPWLGGGFKAALALGSVIRKDDLTGEALPSQNKREG